MKLLQQGWLIIAGLFIQFWLLRALFYYLRLKEISKLKEVYHQYLHNNNYDFAQSKPRIIELFKLADLKDFVVMHIEQVSYAQSFQTTLNGFNNMTSFREDIVVNIKLKFEETIGVFRQRMHQSYSPFYWFEFIFKLPTKIFSYIDISLPNPLLNLIQIFYWLCMITFGLIKLNILNILPWS